MADDTFLEVIDLREYVGKSKSALNRIRGRIIGLNGKSRKIIEELSGGYSQEMMEINLFIGQN